MKHFVIGLRLGSCYSRIVANTASMQTGANSMTDLNTLSKDQLIAMLAAASAPKALTMKVSEKGALSIYGLGRFPVTLYRGQIERLLAHAPTIHAFIKANDTLLAVKA
jgi:hypothetical protein